MSSESPYGRTMPHSLEAEELLISCCLLDGAEIISRCVEAKITADSFYDTKHGVLFAAMLDLYNRQKPIATDILAEELKTARKLDEVGGYAFLAQVSSRIPTTAQSGYFIEKVREHALLRSMIRAGTSIVEDCFSYSGGLDQFVDQAESKFFAVTQNRVSENNAATPAAVDAAMAMIQSMTQNRGKITGLSSGYIDIDELTWGFQAPDLIVLAARPSMGKTALALNFAEHITMPFKQSAKPGAVMVFSLEMGAPQLVMRMICSRAKVNMKLMRSGFVGANSDEQRRIDRAAHEIRNAPLFIDDSSGITVSYIRARARRRHQRTPLKFIIVDYLQLMAPTDPKANREQQVAEASRGLKGLAKELNVPVLVLSQLNRGSEKENRRPKLSDLRESGAIEQDADIVMMLARPKEASEDYQVADDEADLIVGKQRNGPVGDIRLRFHRDITRFDNFSPKIAP